MENLAWRPVELARSLADRTERNSTNSSRPPSSDDPYRRGETRERAETDKDRTDKDEKRRQSPRSYIERDRRGTVVSNKSPWRLSPHLVAGKKMS